MPLNIVPHKKTNPECLEWLGGSNLDTTSREKNGIWIRMTREKEKVTMVAMKWNKSFVVMSNRPGTSVEACKDSVYDIHGKNMPDVVRNFLEGAKIDNPKGLKI